MGFSVSGAMVVILIGVLVAFGLMVPAVVDGFDRVSAAQDDRTDRLVDRMNADFIVDSTQTPGGGFRITLVNTGSVGFSISSIDVLIDGEYTEAYTTSVDGSEDTDLWLPGEELVIEDADAWDGNNPDWYKIVTELGLEASGEL